MVPLLETLFKSHQYYPISLNSTLDIHFCKFSSVSGHKVNLNNNNGRFGGNGVVVARNNNGWSGLGGGYGGNDNNNDGDGDGDNSLVIVDHSVSQGMNTSHTNNHHPFDPLEEVEIDLNDFDSEFQSWLVDSTVFNDTLTESNNNTIIRSEFPFPHDELSLPLSGLTPLSFAVLMNRGETQILPNPSTFGDNDIPNPDRDDDIDNMTKDLDLEIFERDWGEGYAGEEDCQQVPIALQCMIEYFIDSIIENSVDETHTPYHCDSVVEVWMAP